jgi:hypothetical protein
VWPLRIIALLGCAEWLLIFRTWGSFRYLLLYAGFAALRLFYFLQILPHWDNNYFLVGASIVAVVWHLRALWRANTSQNQQTYDTPETGVPWLVIVTHNRQYAFGLECAIIVVFIFYMANYGRLILPPGVQSHTTAKAFAWISAIWMLFSYSLWNAIVSGKPLWPTRATPPREPYQHVREETHTPPPLPSVKDLSDDLSNFYN